MELGKSLQRIGSAQKKSIRRWARKLRNIALSYWRLAIGNDPPYAKPRRKICHACPKMKCGVCTICGCPIATKPRIEDESCPLGKW